MDRTTTTDISGPDRITDVGLRLFAQLGYDNVSAQMIADAAGVDLEAIRRRGGKSGVYRKILDDFYRAQNALLDEIEERYSADAEGVQRSLARFVEFDLEHPYELAVWQHRGLKDAADLAEIETQYWNPVYQRIVGIFGPEIMRHPAYLMFLNLKTWAVYGFLFGGVNTIDGWRLGPETQEGRKLFRNQMHQLRETVLNAGLRDAI